MKKYILFLLSGALFTSCIDTIVLPTDRTVAEDYWQSKDDVTAMVTGAYKQMASTNVIERFLVWGDFRSEELELVDPFTDVNNGTYQDLLEIKSGTMDNENGYASWADIYSIINKCNIVLERAPQVVSIDPSYTEGNLRTDRSQMLALRALCYFYLVRTVRDVPVTEGASFNSSQNFVIPQQAPLTVLNKCVDDLTEALQTPLSPTGYSDWRRVGYLNRTSINAILADVYLWRASMTGNLSDYEECVKCCDAVIKAKQDQYLSDGAQVPFAYGNINYNGYPLFRGQVAYNWNFIQGNSMESIFELQFDSNNSNLGLMHFFWNYDGGSSRSNGFVKAPQSRFTTSGVSTSSEGGLTVYGSSADYRLYESCYANDDQNVSQYFVAKNVATTTLGNRDDDDMSCRSLMLPTERANFNFHNWIVYRLTDVMLMKAEALVQLSEQDPVNLQRALGLVNTVLGRSIAKANVTQSDTVAWNSTSQSKSGMESIVLRERQRELCFEGKRWYDVLRYAYRQLRANGVILQPELTMHEISDNVEDFPSTYETMSQVLAIVENAQLSMEYEPHLYMPVLRSEITVNNLLHQNPAYAASETIVKQ